MPWCAVKQHFNLICLNNFLGYVALIFDCQECLIIWFYIWEIMITVYFHFSQEHSCHIVWKLFLANGCMAVFGSVGCVLSNVPVWIKAACERFSGEHIHAFSWVKACSQENMLPCKLIRNQNWGKLMKTVTSTTFKQQCQKGGHRWLRKRKLKWP